jgi:hypothetical protein
MRRHGPIWDQPFEGDPVITIVATRDPDGSPACLLRWSDAEWVASVEDVRMTALDLMVCAAYAEVMMHLLKVLKLPAETVSRLFADLMRSATGRECFGTRTTFAMSPAGSSSAGRAFVVFVRGSLQGGVSANEARNMALAWLQVAEASESDQLVVEALRTAGHLQPGELDGMFAYLQALRTQREQRVSEAYPEPQPGECPTPG